LCRVGNGFSATKKFRNAKVNPRVTFLIDEVLPPWRPRAVMIYGLATTLEGGADREAMTRFLQRVISWAWTTSGQGDAGSDRTSERTGAREPTAGC